MPNRSKFTQERRERILQALQVGAHRTTAAALAGIDEAQIRRWIARGKEASPGTQFREFYEQVLEAEAAPRMRALGIIYKELPDRPDLAWKFVERKEPGYAPAVPGAASGPAPVVINLSFADGRPVHPVIEGEFVEQEESASRALPDPTSAGSV